MRKADFCDQQSIGFHGQRDGSGAVGLNERQAADGPLGKPFRLKVLPSTTSPEGAASKPVLALGLHILAEPVTMDVLARRIRDTMNH
jgi:hypothetical protein